MRLILNAVFCVFSLFIFIQRNCYSCDNIPPVADLRAVPECVTLGKSVILDGNTSFDPDGCIDFYGFNVTSVVDNYDYMGTPPPIVAEHTYKKPGVYTARLTIKDNDGGGDADTCTITVTKVHNLTQNKPYSSIQNAINDANDFDVIEVSKGTYIENISFNGKNITVRSIEPNNWNVACNTVIKAADANCPAVSFTNSESEDAILSGFKITGGSSGIQCIDSQPVIRNCMIKGNGKAGVSGGGLAIFNSSQAFITNCYIVDNKADYGAGVYNNESDYAVIRNCVVSKNIAFYDGGGIYNNACSSDIYNCTFTQNQATRGGSMCSFSGDPDVYNSIFWSNLASEQDDEICNLEGSEPDFYSCNIEGCGGHYAWNSEIGIDEDGSNIDKNPCFGGEGVVEEGLVARWKFDDGEGNLVEDSVANFDGHFYGDLEWSEGIIDNSLCFDGNDRVEIESSDGHNSPLNIYDSNLTISAWVKTDGTTGGTIVKRSKNGLSAYTFFIDEDSQIGICTYDDSSGHYWELRSYYSPLIPNQWSHVLAVLDRSKDVGSLYINGEKVAGLSRTENPSSCDSTTMIGCEDNGFTGLIDEVRIYNRALSESEVNELYEYGLTEQYPHSLTHYSPCRNNGNNDSGNTGNYDIDDELRIRKGSIDIGADEYITTEFPYICSFEEYQGYSDWNWFGAAYDIKQADYESGTVAHEYQYVDITDDANLYRNFVNEDSNNSIIRINCIPSKHADSYINIKNDSNTIASIWFDYDNDTIAVLDNLDNGNYIDLNDYQSVSDQCRIFLNNDDPCMAGYSYENTWIDFKIVFDWENDSYDVYWKHWNNSNYESILTGALLGDTKGSKVI